MMLEKKNSEQGDDNLIRITSKGDFDNTFRFLKKMSNFKVKSLCSVKDAVKRMRRQVMECKKIFSKYTSLAAKLWYNDK